MHASEAMISAEEFAAGAQQLAAVWSERLPDEPPWRWVPADHPFAASQVGAQLPTSGKPAPLRAAASTSWVQVRAAGTCPARALLACSCPARRVAATLRHTALPSWHPAAQRQALAAKGRMSLRQRRTLMPTLQTLGGRARPPPQPQAQQGRRAWAWPATSPTTRPTKCLPCTLR